MASALFSDRELVDALPRIELGDVELYRPYYVWDRLTQSVEISELVLSSFDGQRLLVPRTGTALCLTDVEWLMPLPTLDQWATSRRLVQLTLEATA